MNNTGRESGFTFVELVVVIGIFSVLLLFSIPLFRDIHLFSGGSEKVSKLVFLIQSLKQKAVAQNQDFFLHIDIQTGRVWVTDASMNTEALAKAEQEGISYADGTRILNLEFPGAHTQDQQHHTLCFRRQGYSDGALIHLKESSENITLDIGVFLTRVERFNRYVSYNDCI